jgi:hypothetical protein
MTHRNINDFVQLGTNEGEIQMKYSISKLSVFFALALTQLATSSWACPEFKFCAGESAVSNDGFLVQIVAMKSPDVAMIRNDQGTILSYETKYLAKTRGCNSAGLCAGDLAISADNNQVRVAGIFGCGSSDVAIKVNSTQGGYLRYGSQYLTRENAPQNTCE